MEKSSSLCQVFVEHLLCRCRYVFIGKTQTKSFHSETFRILGIVSWKASGSFLDYGSLVFLYFVSQKFLKSVSPYSESLHLSGETSPCQARNYFLVIDDAPSSSKY